MQITKDVILKILNWRNIRVIENLDLNASINQAHNQLADYLSTDQETPDIGSQVILITSANPKEGKTSIAVNLALTCSRRKPGVLIIDGDLRHSLVHKYLKIDQTPGLAEQLNSDDDFIVAVRGLSVLTAGSHNSLGGSPGELLGSQKMEDLLTRYRADFDLIIIDSPCLKTYRDALSLGKLVDKVFLVVEANKTPKRSVSMAINKILASQKNFAGLILNKQINRVPFFIQDMLR